MKERPNAGDLPVALRCRIGKLACRKCGLSYASESVQIRGVRCARASTSGVVLGLRCAVCSQTGVRLLRVTPREMRAVCNLILGYPAYDESRVERKATDPEDDQQVEIRRVPDLLRERLPARFSPRSFRDRLTELGYCGIDADPQVREVVKQVSLLAYQHARRLQQIHLDGADRASLPPKRNALMVGPTGSGKTYLLTLVFEKILGLPCTVVDCSSMTSAGYAGDNVASIVPRLIEKADKNVPYAQCGVVILDEVDKISRRNGNNENWLKADTQNELLRLLQGGEATVSRAAALGKILIDAGKAQLRTDDVMFVGCGAFSGIESIITASREQAHWTDHRHAPVRSSDLSSAVFEQYGFVPEFVGRFSSFMALPPVSLETMKSIARSALQRERKRWELEGCGADFDDWANEGFVETIASDALAQGTGVRGVTTAIGDQLDEMAFGLFEYDAGTASTSERAAATPHIATEGEIAKDPHPSDDPQTIVRHHFRWEYIYYPIAREGRARKVEIDRLDVRVPRSVWRRFAGQLTPADWSELVANLVGMHDLKIHSRWVEIALHDPVLVDTEKTHRDLHRMVLNAERSQMAA